MNELYNLLIAFIAMLCYILSISECIVHNMPVISFILINILMLTILNNSCYLSIEVFIVQ